MARSLAPDATAGGGATGRVLPRGTDTRRPGESHHLAAPRVHTGTVPVAVIGDLGGHATELVGALRRLGVDMADPVLPADLTVVQVGDLIGPGPDNDLVLELVDHLLGAGRWIQLVGHQEAALLGGPPAVDGPTLDRTAVERIRGWWDDGRLRPAIAVEPADHAAVLITHAGLTQGLWNELRRPSTAHLAADVLVAAAHDRPEIFFRAGHGLGRPKSMAAGPVWASCAEELYPSLGTGAQVGKPVPFGQIHGHSTPYDWTRGLWRAGERERLGLRADRERRIVVGTVGGQPMAAVDPDLGSCAGVRWQPLVLRAAHAAAAA